MNRERLRALLLEAIALKDVPRAGWIRHGIGSPESVAAHSWGVSWLVLVLCPPELDRHRALAMAILHDLPEVRCGDITPHDAISREEKDRLERDALRGLLEGSPRQDELSGAWEEYQSADTAEARFVKACDKLDMALQAERYSLTHPETSLQEFVDSALSKLQDSELAGLIQRSA